MKKVVLVFVLAAAVLVVGVTMAAADSDNAALVISLEEGCEWQFEEIQAGGSVHYVEVNHGKWKLTCIGQIVDGSLPEKAIVYRSTADDPQGTCYTPFDTTFDFQLVYTPGGESSFVCHGDLSP